LSGIEQVNAEALAEKKLQDLVEPIRASAGEAQCTQASEAFAKTWATGVQHEVAPTAISIPEGRTMDQMQKLFNGSYEPLGDVPSLAIKRITEILEQQGPGSQALIKVSRLTEVGQDAAGVTELDQFGHSFNAVNVDGFVKFVDVGKAGTSGVAGADAFILTPKDLETSYGWAIMKL
jgi:hypothetical protein